MNLRSSNRLKSIFLILVMIIATAVAARKCAATQKAVPAAKNILEDEEMFEFIKERNMAKTYAYFEEKYGVSFDEDFWERDCNGENPKEYLDKISEEEYKRIAAAYSIAKDLGIDKDFTFKGINERLQKENEERKKRISEGKVVFGLQQYDFGNYFDYEYSNLKIESIRRYKEKLEISEEKLREIYEKKTEVNPEIKKSFDELKDAIKKELAEEQYELAVKERVSSAKTVSKNETDHAFLIF